MSEPVESSAKATTYYPRNGFGRLLPHMLTVVVGVLLFPLAASAYFGKSARLRVVASADGNSLLRIEPGIAPTTKSPAGRTAQATVFRFDKATNAYLRISTFPLRNPLAPATAVISNDGETVVTCDDWDWSVGRGPNVVVIYRGSGEVVRAWRLEEIFTPSEISRFGPLYQGSGPRFWRGEHVRLVEGAPHGPRFEIPFSPDLRWQVEISLDLRTLEFVRRPVRIKDR